MKITGKVTKDGRIEAMRKSGEGSRGGHVVGHTKSGRPIYEGSRGAGNMAHHATERTKDVARAHHRTLSGRISHPNTAHVLLHREAAATHRMAALGAPDEASRKKHHEAAHEHIKAQAEGWDKMHGEDHEEAFHYHADHAQSASTSTSPNADHEARMHHEEAWHHADEAADKYEQAGDTKNAKRWRENAKYRGRVLGFEHHEG